ASAAPDDQWTVDRPPYLRPGRGWLARGGEPTPPEAVLERIDRKPAPLPHRRLGRQANQAHRARLVHAVLGRTLDRREDRGIVERARDLDPLWPERREARHVQPAVRDRPWGQRDLLAPVERTDGRSQRAVDQSERRGDPQRRSRGVQVRLHRPGPMCGLSRRVQVDDARREQTLRRLHTEELDREAVGWDRQVDALVAPPRTGEAASATLSPYESDGLVVERHWLVGRQTDPDGLRRFPVAKRRRTRHRLWTIRKMGRDDDLHTQHEHTHPSRGDVRVQA